MITHLKIEHYKSIAEADLDLSNLTLFVGPNGSGKSNLIDAVRLVRDAVTYGLDRAISDRQGIDSIRQWSPSRPYDVSLDVRVQDANGYGRLAFTLVSSRGQHQVKAEYGIWKSNNAHGKLNSWFWYQRDAGGRTESHSVVGADSTPKQAERILLVDQTEELFLATVEARDFRPLMDALANFEAYSIFPNILRTPQKALHADHLTHDADNLTSVFKALTRSKSQSHQRSRNEILTGLQKVMPTLENIRIQSLGGLMVPVFRVKEADGRVHDFNVSQISDGTLRVLGLLTALYQPSRPDVIAMEEPEQTVHTGILPVLAEAIKECSTESQVLVTTHSPELMDHFDPENVMAVELVDGVTQIGPISAHQREAVKDRLFSLGELMTVEGLHP
jgi:predicted ATPase